MVLTSCASGTTGEIEQAGPTAPVQPVVEVRPSPTLEPSPTSTLEPTPEPLPTPTEALPKVYPTYDQETAILFISETEIITDVMPLLAPSDNVGSEQPGLPEIISAVYQGPLVEECQQESSHVFVGWHYFPREDDNSWSLGYTSSHDGVIIIYLPDEQTIADFLKNSECAPEEWQNLPPEMKARLTRILQEIAFQHELHHGCSSPIERSVSSKEVLDKIGVNLEDFDSIKIVGFEFYLPLGNETWIGDFLNEVINSFITYQQATEEQKEVMDQICGVFGSVSHQTLLEALDHDETLSQRLLELRENSDIFGLKDELEKRFLNEAIQPYELIENPEVSEEEYNAWAKDLAEQVARRFMASTFTKDPDEEFSNFLEENGVVFVAVGKK